MIPSLQSERWVEYTRPASEPAARGRWGVERESVDKASADRRTKKSRPQTAARHRATSTTQPWRAATTMLLCRVSAPERGPPEQTIDSVANWPKYCKLNRRPTMRIGVARRIQRPVGSRLQPGILSRPSRVDRESAVFEPLAAGGQNRKMRHCPSLRRCGPSATCHAKRNWQPCRAQEWFRSKALR